MADEADLTCGRARCHLSLIDQINEALTVVGADIAVHALQDPTIRRLMTLPGLDVTVAASVASVIGDIHRFNNPQRLVSYLGLNSSVRRSCRYRLNTVSVR